MARSGSRGAGLRRAIVAIVATAAAPAAAGAVPLPPPRPGITAIPAVPLPPARPEEDGPPMPPAVPPLGPAEPPNEAAAPPPAPPDSDATCPSLLGSGTVVATALPPIAERGGCGIAAPVRVEAFVLRDGRHVPLVPAATMRCDLATVLAAWLRDDVVPATADDGTLVAVADAAAYQCRSRNRLPGERLSEHARGNAVDILALRFTGRTLSVADTAARPFWAALKASACRRFATVLGPGSDAYHATDLHLDLEHRRSGAHLCQWDVS